MYKMEKFNLEEYTNVPEFIIFVALLLSSLNVLPIWFTFYKIYFIATIILQIIVDILAIIGFAFLRSPDDIKPGKKVKRVTRFYFSGVYVSSMLVAIIMKHPVWILFVTSFLIRIVGELICLIILEVRGLPMYDIYIQRLRSYDNDKIIREYSDMKDMICLNSSGKEQKRLLRDVGKYYYKMLSQ